MAIDSPHQTLDYQNLGPQNQGKVLENFSCFQQLAIELQNLIWEETFAQTRVFDDSTLRLLNPQDGVMYSYLIPYALSVSRGSRAFAQERLSHTALIRRWPSNSRRIIYFNPDSDISIFQFTDLSWAKDFIPGQCIFSQIEILANVDPALLASTVGYGLRGTQFSQRFPRLRRLLIRDRDINLKGVVLRNEWYEDQWIKESRLKENIWNKEWKLVKDYFKEKGIEFVISRELPQEESQRKEFIATFHACHSYAL
jgi:hypothetical protein